MKSNDRDITLDIMKGICIILVVLGHTYTPYISNFIYLFHVAVFFMISGVCFNEKYLESANNFFVLLKKRIVNLWLPYVCYNFVFLLLQNFFIKIGFLTDNPDYFLCKPYLPDGFSTYINFSQFPKIILKSFLFINSRPFVGGLWFLGGLFFVTFLYAIIQIVMKKLKIEKFHIIVSLCLLIAAWIAKETGFMKDFPLTKQAIIIFETEILFTLGVYFQKYFLSKYRQMKRQHQIAVFSISFIILLFLNRFGSISIASSRIVNPAFYLISSILGFFLLLSFAFLIKDIKISIFFHTVGKNTLPILALHTLCFKVVTFIQSISFQEDVLNSNGGG